MLLTLGGSSGPEADPVEAQWRSRPKRGAPNESLIAIAGLVVMVVLEARLLERGTLLPLKCGRQAKRAAR